MLSRIGRSVIGHAREFLYGAGFLFQVIRRTSAFPRQRYVGLNVLVLQILFTGFEAFGIIALVSLPIGASIIVQVTLLVQPTPIDDYMSHLLSSL